MKHNLAITIELLIWTFMTGILAVTITPLMSREVPPAIQGTSPIIWAGILIGAVIGSALLWFFMMKKFESATVEWIWSILVALVVSEVCSKIIRFYVSQTITMIAITLAIYLSIALLYHHLIIKMQKDWKSVRRYYWVSNLLIVALAVFAGANIGTMLGTTISMIFLVLLAIYDAYMVWKAKKMQVLVTFLVKHRLFGSIIVPKEKKEEFAILGAGDLLVLSMMASAFSVSVAALGMLVMLGMFSSIVVLFGISEKKRFYPAIPFMLIGFICAMAIQYSTLAAIVVVFILLAALNVFFFLKSMDEKIKR